MFLPMPRPWPRRSPSAACASSRAAPTVTCSWWTCSRRRSPARTPRRRRKCLKCEKRFTTYERVDLKMPRLVKKDGSRTDFDRDKLLGSMMLALRKRPVATDEVESAVDHVIERLRSLGEREVSTNRVGDVVMRELAKLDKIAYIRFASVHRQLETLDDV